VSPFAQPPRTDTGEEWISVESKEHGHKDALLNHVQTTDLGKLSPLPQQTVRLVLWSSQTLVVAVLEQNILQAR
jgi:hypothetical protein